MNIYREVVVRKQPKKVNHDKQRYILLRAHTKCSNSAFRAGASPRPEAAQPHGAPRPGPGPARPPQPPAGSEAARAEPAAPEPGPGGRFERRSLTCLIYMTAEGAGGALPAAHSASNRHKRPAPPRAAAAAAAPQRPAAPLRAAPRSPRTQTKWRRGLPRPGPARTTGHLKKGGRGEGSAPLAGWRRERAGKTERTAFKDYINVFLAF